MLKMNLMLIVDFFSLIEKHRLKRYKSVKIYSWTPRVIKEKVSHRRLPFPDCFRLHMLQLCRDSSGHLSLCVCLCARVCVCVCESARERLHDRTELYCRFTYVFFIHAGMCGDMDV